MPDSQKPMAPARVRPAAAAAWGWASGCIGVLAGRAQADLAALVLLLLAAAGLALAWRGSRQTPPRASGPDLAPPVPPTAPEDALARLAVDHLPGRVSYWDRSLHCRFANRLFCERMGRRADQLLGRTMQQIYGEAYALTLQAPVAAVLAGEPQTFERDGVDADGVQRTRLIRYVPHHEGDRVVGFLVLATDITELMQARRQLDRQAAELAQQARELALRAEQAEAATRAKSAFLANMSHEIRTPMNAILGLTHLMLRQSSDASQQERLRKVDNAGRHLLQIINDVLDLSKIEAGKLRLEKADFLRDDLFARAVNVVSDAASAKGLELVLDVDHLPERLRGDLKHLAQALINLLGNAVKFTERGHVRLRGEVLTDTGHRLQLRFVVQDSGIGIAPELQAQLFQAFEQVDASATRRHQGTGLGLALTRHLARLMGGEVGLSSQPGHGSSFWFTAWLDRAADPAALPAQPVAMAGRRALLVDDLPEARQALADQLTLLGLKVDALADGASAVEHVRAGLAAGRRHDVVLVDWRMPGLDGLETLQRLRKLAGERTPPAILVTADDSDDMWQRSQAAGCAAVLLKPVTPSTLHDALLRVFAPDSPPPAAPAEDGAEQLRRLHGGCRVLLAEDHPVNQEVAMALLESVGLAVEVAHDGVEAVALAQTGRFDLVLMDIQMPALDGYAATRRIRATVGRQLPVVAMTANAFDDDRGRCLAAGMNDHVAKPVEPARLFDTLLRWLPTRPADAATTGAPTGPSAAAAAAAGAQPATTLPAIPGLDLPLALRHVGGDPDWLLQVLRTFAQQYRSGQPALAEALALGQRAAARAHAHALRGACAAIGAQQLTEGLQALEAALVDDTPAAAASPALLADARDAAGPVLQGLEQVVAAIERALAEPARSGH